VTNFFFIQLCLLILGKDSPTADNIGVFMRPLLDELHKLWVGIMAQDFSQQPRERQFKLRGILVWTVCDYPALGLISGLQTHEYKACVVCGPEMQSRSAKCGNKLDREKKEKGRKIVFLSGRRWTHRNHPYRFSTDFNGSEERLACPVQMTGAETIRCADERHAFLMGGRRENSRDDLVHVHGVRMRSCLDEFPYWQVCLCNGHRFFKTASVFAYFLSFLPYLYHLYMNY
jgi:hypothetical protein